MIDRIDHWKRRQKVKVASISVLSSYYLRLLSFDRRLSTYIIIIIILGHM